MNRLSSLKSILALLLGIATLVGLVLSYDWPLIHDAATNHYIADQILRAKIPYLELFDMNFPGAYLPHLFTLFLMGNSDLAWRITEYLAILISLWGIWKICQPVSKALGFIAAFSWALFHLGNGSVYQGQRDWWIALLLVIASVYLLRSIQHKKVKHEDLFFMSALIGFAGMIKPFAFGFFPLAFFFHLSRTTGKTNWLKTFAASATGLSVVPLSLLTWLFITGGLSPFVDIFMSYSLKIYGSISIPSTFSSIFAYGKIAGFFVFAIALAFSFLKRFQSRSDSIAVLSLGTLYGLFHFLFQAKGWNYQAYPLFIFALPLALSFIEKGTLLKRRSKMKTIAFSALLIFTCLLATRGVMRTLGDESIQKIKPYVNSLVQDLEEIDLDEQANVQVMDTALGGLHALLRTNLQQSSRTLYDFHFQVQSEAPFVQSLKNDFINDMQSKKPELVIILEKGWLAPHSYARHDSFPEFLALLKSDYHLYRDRSDYRIYRLN